MWKLEQEEYYFRIVDARQTAGYFDPEYGGLLPHERQDEAVEAIWKRREAIPGGYLMIGLAKLGVYGVDGQITLRAISASLGAARKRIRAWDEALSDERVSDSFVGVSHTDQDMLTVSFPVAFSRPTPLDEKKVAAELSPILDRLRQRSLL